MANEFKEPVCCCCGVRTGLAVTHGLFLALGLLFVLSSVGYYIDGFLFLEGILILVASAFGLASTVHRKQRWIRYMLLIYPIIGTAILVLILVDFILAGQQYNSSLENSRDRNSNVTDDDIRELESSFKTYLAINGVVQIGLGLVILLSVMNRTKAYKQWLLDIEYNRNSWLANDQDAELKTIFEPSLKDDFKII